MTQTSDDDEKTLDINGICIFGIGDAEWMRGV